MNSKFKRYEAIFPGYKKITVLGRPASEEIKKKGPNVVDPQAIIEAAVTIEQAEQLVKNLQQLIQSAKANKINVIAFYVRDPDLDIK